MFALAYLVPLAISAMCALPGDYARRRAGRQTAGALALANAAGLLGAIGLVAALGIASGLGGIADVVFGLVTGQQLADSFATRAWGAALRG